MRVLLVSAHGADPAYGGAERYVRDLSIGLRTRGHQVAVLSAFPPRGEREFGTHVLHRSDWRDDRLRRIRNHVGDVVSAPWPRFGAVLRNARPDLVHTNNLPGIGSGIWEVARRAGVPIVHTLHDYHLLCPRTSLIRRDGKPCNPSPVLCGARTRRLARWADSVQQVIAGSEHLLRAHRGLFPAAQDSIIRLPLAAVGGGPAVAPHSPPLRLGFLGALTATKGVKLLLAATPLLAGKGVEVSIAGDGPLRQEVRNADVEYLGRVEGQAKVDFLMSCDVGIVPSLWDEPSGPPYVVCEWLAAGRPVLATRRGGLAEATRSGGVVPFDESPAGLVKAAQGLRDRDRWRRVLGTVPIVNGDADVERWLDEHEAAYGAALLLPRSHARV